MNNRLQETVEQMKRMADMLVPHSFPKVESYDTEQQILCLKTRVVIVDGYEIVLCFSRADYDKYILETLQIQSQQAPFLPFNVVCKIGQMFFGTKHLSYIDFFRFNRKVYCWAVKSVEGRLLSPAKQATPANFEGFEFYMLNPGSVDLF